MTNRPRQLPHRERTDFMTASRVNFPTVKGPSS